jgi:methylated-DNA-[protein]-cysteine S-methyltransferase
MKICYQEITTDIGRVTIAADNNHLRVITFGGNNWDRIKEKLGQVQCEGNAIIQKTQIQLQEYFAGKRTTFEIPLAFTGTEFQQQSWQALLTIPYGETRSYADQAKLIGNPKAVRAVGRANGLNAISIVVPCHRVIGKSGKLTGYAGGLKIKKFLLRLEGAMP